MTNATKIKMGVASVVCLTAAALGVLWVYPPPVAEVAPQGLVSRVPADFAAAVKSDSARSSKWESVRKLHLKREPCCAWCGGTFNLQVHHIHPFALTPGGHGSDAPGGELDDGKDGTGKDGNLITLCMVPKDKAKRPEDADHHELYGHSGHFKGGENLQVREQCAAHEKELRAAGKWPDNETTE